MPQKWIIVIALMLLALGVSDARMPKVGDQVGIDMINGHGTTGIITDIGNGLICLSVNDAYGTTKPYDLCVGVGSIFRLTWL
jgi:Zn-dependent alcohol dehydrogenase